MHVFLDFVIIMFMKKTLAIAAILSCVIVQNAFSQNIMFSHINSRHDEQSILQFLLKGEWVHTEREQPKPPANARAVLLGRPKRDAHDLLSFQEQQELDRYVQIRLQRLQLEQDKQEEEVPARKSHAKMRPHAKGQGIKTATLPIEVEIPKILREEAGSICVPQLTHLKSVDWQAHLVCAGSEK